MEPPRPRGARSWPLARVGRDTSASPKPRQAKTGYHDESALRFGSSAKKRQIENLHKLFALTVALPSLRPLVERLIRLPPNDFFYAAFRAWYVVAHMSEVMPRRPRLRELGEALASVLGIYRGTDPNRYPLPPLDELPMAATNRMSPEPSLATEPRDIALGAASVSSHARPVAPFLGPK